MLLLEQVCKVFCSPAVEERHNQNQDWDTDDNEKKHHTDSDDHAEDDPEKDDRQDVLEPAGFADHTKDRAKTERCTKSVAGKVDQCRDQKEREQNEYYDTEKESYKTSN